MYVPGSADHIEITRMKISVVLPKIKYFDDHMFIDRPANADAKFFAREFVCSRNVERLFGDKKLSFLEKACRKRLFECKRRMVSPSRSGRPNSIFEKAAVRQSEAICRNFVVCLSIKSMLVMKLA